MKQSQWTFALVVLAGLVFIVTFAMNYLGGGRPPLPGGDKPKEPRYVRFFWKEAGPLETEEKTTSFQDFWFCNDNRESVKVGLDGTSCKCSSVQLFLLPEYSRPFLFAEAAALWGTARLGFVSALTTHEFAMQMLRSMEPEGYGLAKDKEPVDVPGGAVGWVRMRWKGEKPGPQTIGAYLWMDFKGNNAPTVLNTSLYFHQPLRVRSTDLDLHVLHDEELEKGVIRYITCWSSTRTSLRLDAKTAGGRENPATDPFQVGKPVALSQREITDLEKKNNASPTGGSDNTAGRVLCAYRIPITLRSVAPDGKTPFDIGPFARAVNLACSDVNVEPKQVVVRGRVLGIVEVGSDEEGGNINLRTFKSSAGRTELIYVHSEVKGLTLQFDDERTSKFVKASLGKPTAEKDGRQTWPLHLEVLKNKVFGVFPRRDDPLYEDSAVYLKAAIPGKPDRTIRIAIHGTATSQEG